MADRDKQMLIEVIVDDQSGEPVVKRNAKAIRELEGAAKQSGQQVEFLGKKTLGLRDGTKGAHLAMMDFGRIVQDLPFGLRGVANNIDPFIASMRRVRTQTGGWVAAGKTLLGTLAGPAGIAIAVSSLTSLLLTFGPQIADFFGIFDDGAEKVDKADKEIDTFLGKQTELLLSKLNEIEAFKPTGPFDTRQLDAQLRLISQTLNTLPDVLTEQEKARLDFLGTSVPSLSEAEKQERRELILRQTQAKQFAEQRAELENRMNELLEKQLVIRSAANTEQGKRIQQLHAEQRLQELLLKTKEARSSVQTKRPEEVIIEQGIDVGFGPAERTIEEAAFARARANEELTNALLRYGVALDKINGLSEKQGQNLLFQIQAAKALNQTIEQGLIRSFSQLGTILGDVLFVDFEGGLFQRFQLLFSDFLSAFGDQLIVLGIGKLALDNLFATGIGGPAAIAAGIALKAAAQLAGNDASKRLANITGSASGSSTQNVLGFRGFTGQRTSASERFKFPEFPRTVRLEDKAGNFLTKLQFAQDKAGGRPYLVDRED